jgi:hypothetical protein
MAGRLCATARRALEVQFAVLAVVAAVEDAGAQSHPAHSTVEQNHLVGGRDVGGNPRRLADQVTVGRRPVEFVGQGGEFIGQPAVTACEQEAGAKPQ